MNNSLLLQAERCGLFHLPAGRLPALRKAAEHENFTASTVDLAHCPDASSLLQALGEALKFPDWYGANFDALHDCLSDPELVGNKGLVLILLGLETMRQANPEDFATLVEVLQSVAASHRANHAPCWIISDCRARDIPLLPEA